MAALARFSLDGAAPPLVQNIAGIVANDLASIVLIVTGFAPTDVIEQASFTAKLAKTDSDTAPTTVQVIFAPEAPEGPTVVQLDANSYVITFPLAMADTQKLLTVHGYDVRIWARGADNILRYRTVQNGTVVASLGWTSLDVMDPDVIGMAVILPSFGAVVVGSQIFNGPTAISTGALAMVATAAQTFGGSMAVQGGSLAAAATMAQTFAASIAASLSMAVAATGAQTFSVSEAVSVGGIVPAVTAPQIFDAPDNAVIGALAAAIASDSGVYLNYHPGDSLAASGMTFTRAGSATYRDTNGIVQTAGTNVLRDNHFPVKGGARHALREQASTNGIRSNRDYTGTDWLRGALVTCALNATGVDGVANSATTISAIAVSGSIRSNAGGVAATAGQKYVVFACVNTSSTSPFCYLADQGDASNHRTWFNITTHAFGTQNNVDASGIIPLGGNYYLIWITYTATNSYTQDFIFGMSDTDNSTVCTIGHTLIADAMQGEAGVAPSSIIFTAGSPVTRASDIWYSQIPIVIPAGADLSIYAAGTEIGCVLFKSSSNRLTNVGSTNNPGTPGLAIREDQGSGKFQVLTQDSTGSANTLSSGLAAPAYGDTYTAVQDYRFSDAAARISISKNGGAVTVNGFTAGAADPTKFVGVGTFIVLCNAGAYKYAAFTRLIVARGWPTTAQFQAMP